MPVESEQDASTPALPPPFSPGDVVMLRSGGAHMTVSNVDPLWVGKPAVTMVYYNPHTGIIEKFTTYQECIRLVTSKPTDPADVNAMRSTSVAKSSLS